MADETTMKFFCKKCSIPVTPKIEIVKQLSNSPIQIYFCSQCNKRLLELGGRPNLWSGIWEFALFDLLRVIYFEIKRFLCRSKSK